MRELLRCGRKMEKAVKKDAAHRKLSGKTRKPSQGPRPPNALAAKKTSDEKAWKAAIAIAAGTAAYADVAKLLADPVRFDNPSVWQPGHFSWRPTLKGNLFEQKGEQWLDVTLAPALQTGLSTSPASIEQYVHHYAYGVRWSWLTADDAYTRIECDNSTYLVDQEAGTRIPSELPWTNLAMIYLSQDWYCGCSPECHMSEGPTYLGLKFDLGNGIQYGWVTVTRDSDTLEALAWGYETTPGMPIAAGAAPPCPLPGCHRIDIENGDCRVTLEDLAALLAHYGLSGPNVSGDINWDGLVDLTDVALMLQAYGNVCE